MFKDRGTKGYLILLSVIFLLISAICFWTDERLGWIVAFFLFLAWGISLFGLYRRHIQLKRLSDQIDRILMGNFSLDLQDHAEGELSLLKSKIYKVSVMLSEQAALLQKDKIFLSDTLSDISHQLKTPLTSMLMMADLLGDENLPEEKRRTFLSCIRAQLERIQWLVSALLKLSKLDAGAAPMAKEQVCLSDLIEKASEPLAIPMELKNQQILTEGCDGVWVSADCHWTAEALLNVLKNCMEHTPEGGRFSFRAEENPIYTALYLRDSGSGIAKEDLPHIFERFYRGKNAAPDSAGIGLAMAKSIMETQGGTIEVTDTSERGTEFAFKFYRLTV